MKGYTGFLPQLTFNNLVHVRKKPTIHPGTIQNRQSDKHPGSESVRQGEKAALPIQGDCPGNYLSRHY